MEVVTTIQDAIHCRKELQLYLYNALTCDALIEVVCKNF